MRFIKYKDPQLEPVTQFAKLVSLLLGPEFWLGVLLIALYHQTGFPVYRPDIMYPLVIISILSIQLVAYHWATRHKLISAPDMPKRTERYHFFVSVTLIMFLGVLFLRFFQNTFLWDLSTVVFIVVCLNVMITFYWKISIHMAAMTIAIILINILYNWQFTYLSLFIPLVFWSRLYLGRHTLGQLTAGVALNAVVVLGAFAYLGYLSF